MVGWCALIRFKCVASVVFVCACVRVPYIFFGSCLVMKVFIGNLSAMGKPDS